MELLTLSKRRGPDHQGYWSNGTSVQLGFNRLAILELTEAGNQPMLSPQGGYVLVYNGEIYNHLDLRKQLAFKNFLGYSDTETICCCLDEWGIEKTVNKLDGMFALAIYEQHTQATTLVRDFAGIKPLFYGWDGATLVAASQYDQVVKHPAFAQQPIDEQVLKLYLQQHFLPAPFGLLKNTFQVEPGEIVHLSAEGRLDKKRYWTFPEFFQPSIVEKAEALECIHQSLEAAVNQELLSDVPLGAFLSGGIDSPLVCFYVKKYKQQLKTFTIGSDSKVHDETIDAQIYAQLLETEHHTYKMVNENSKESLTEALGCMHEPLADFSIIPTFMVSKLARQQVTVALSGDGGDELFFGYERFWSIAKNINYQHFPWVAKAAIYKADQWITGNRKINSVVLSKNQSQAHQGLHSRFREEWLDRVFPDLKSVALPDTYNTYQYANTKDVSQLIQSMRKAEFYGMMQKTLRKVDLASMENSLEVRVPFLKKSFIEASLKIDPFLSYGRNKKKQLLKDILSSKIPQSPIDNVKRGFTIPLGQWIREDLKVFFEQQLRDQRLSTFGVALKGVDYMLAQHSKGHDIKWPIFTVMALGAWKQNLSV